MMRSAWIPILSAMILMAGCKAYKRDIMFQLDEQFNSEALSKAVDKATLNYLIQPNDILRLDVFTNDGERLLDPNFEMMSGQAGGGGQQLMQQRERFTYLVMADGQMRAPLIGMVLMAGMNINDAEIMLQEKYEEFYKGAFVKLRPVNRRVIVLGAIGGGQTSGGAVVPLENENVTILEAIALAGGVQQGGKVEKIKLVRGEPALPEVFEINLSTISGMRASQMYVRPGDVIYIEPWRRPFRETLRDTAPALSLVTSVLTLIFVLQNAAN
jgi:polysaccharide biosynthesis/export protein